MWEANHSMLTAGYSMRFAFAQVPKLALDTLGVGRAVGQAASFAGSAESSGDEAPRIAGQHARKRQKSPLASQVKMHTGLKIIMCFMGSATVYIDICGGGSGIC